MIKNKNSIKGDFLWNMIVTTKIQVLIKKVKQVHFFQTKNILQN